MKKLDTKSKEHNILDESDISTLLIDNLARKGVVRLVHFGLFKVIQISGRQRYDFKKRKMVPVASFKSITFTPAKGLRELLNKK